MELTIDMFVQPNVFIFEGLVRVNQAEITDMNYFVCVMYGKLRLMRWIVSWHGYFTVFYLTDIIATCSFTTAQIGTSRHFWTELLDRNTVLSKHSIIYSLGNNWIDNTFVIGFTISLQRCQFFYDWFVY